MRLYNTLSGKKEELKLSAKTLRMFVCGPTVYDDSHIGHARTCLSFDIIVRHLRQQGFDVTYIQNITDIDDKIIARAKEKEFNSPLEFARMYEASYLADMQALGITSVSTYARASDFIPEIVGQIQHLHSKGFAYEIENDGWYFDALRFPDYGKLSGRTIAEAEDSVSRIDESIKKRNRADFCLWKFPSALDEPLPISKTISKKPQIRNGEPLWETPLGLGRPGWHIEDTAITEKFYGPQYDIHGGGVEIKFPHHEAEIAQQEAASGKKPFVKYWMHTGSLLVDGKKMAKSVGNVITIKDFLKTDRPEILRWITLSHHYRSPLNYTNVVLEQAKKELSTIEQIIAKLEFVENKHLSGKNKLNTQKKKMEREMITAMDDDINAAVAIASLNGFIGAIQEKLWTLSEIEANELATFLKNTLKTFGFDIKTAFIPNEIIKLAEERELCRTNKQFIQSDTLRNHLLKLGYIIEDTPLGPFLWKSSP